MSLLAIDGGPMVRPDKFAKFNTYDQRELDAASRVIKSGQLSSFLGAAGEGFEGGNEVRAFEEELADFFLVKHAITFNSWTSGLIAAVGALGLPMGSEVLVTPWTMTATATAILHWNLIPVFVDVDFETFNMDPSKIESKLTSRTRAIMVADIFGQSADMNRIIEIAKKNKLRLISDSAQAPGAKYFDNYAGTISDIGGYSLNYHKHIHTGEGGVAVTNCDELAYRMKLIRNHGEAVIDDSDIGMNVLGHNFRMGEIESAIGRVQLAKLNSIIDEKYHQGLELKSRLRNLPRLRVPKIQDGNTHVFYVFGMSLTGELSSTERQFLIDALNAEGIPVTAGYQNIHRLPLYRKKDIFGANEFPWSMNASDYTFAFTDLKNAEYLHDNSYFGIGFCMFRFDSSDIKQVGDAFEKVWEVFENKFLV